MIRSRVALVAALVLVTAVASGAESSTVAPRPPSWATHARYGPTMDPANFAATIDNRTSRSSPAPGFTIAE